MKNSYPRKIGVICEGAEEYEYFLRLKELQVFNTQYVVKLKNAKGINNIFSVYTNEFQNNNSELLFIFCDTDMAPYEEYSKLCAQINRFHGKRNASSYIVRYANPCTLQIMLMHFDSVKLKGNKKSDNAVHIQRYTGVREYRATEAQRKSFLAHINSDNYQIMKKNVLSITEKFDVLPSTNILELFNYLESDSNEWVDKLIRKLY